ncbi:MAG: hypothetical protein ACTHJT_07625 [Cytophaga sp.]|uniref:hypothetical protein n=1 Tax=Cytophaga sp. TaxID=29535 RepID=UPI003F7DB1D4
MSLRSKSTTESLAHLTDLLRKNKKVYFSRYGDGEIYTMVGKDCLEHDVSDALERGLIHSFEIYDPLYLKAVGVNYPVEPGMIHGLFAPYIDNFDLEKYILKHFPKEEGAVYENQILFHYLSVFKPEVMTKFLDEFVRGKRIMFIGSTARDVVEKLYGPLEVYIQIPSKNAFYRMDEWFPEIVKNSHKVDVILPSAGVASNIINARLWDAGVEAHVLDLGSLVDAAEGKGSRKWIKLKGYKVNKVLLPQYQNHSVVFKTQNFFKDIWFEGRKWWKGKNYKLPY